jgi:hypothetical protein
MAVAMVCPYHVYKIIWMDVSDTSIFRVIPKTDVAPRWCGGITFHVTMNYTVVSKERYVI